MCNFIVGISSTLLSLLGRVVYKRGSSRHQRTKLNEVYDIEKFNSRAEHTKRHRQHTFLYSTVRELVRNGQLRARAVLKQLRSYNVG